MNNNNLENFISDLESIKMTSNEKNEIRNNLASFAVAYTPIISPYHHMALLFRRGLAVAFIAILSIGSVSNVVSGQALPGDVLYPVKIAHEEIKLAATFDTKNKVSFEIKRTEKRIQEATELAVQHNLDENVQIEIAENIKEQTQKVQDRIEEVREEEPEEALKLNAELKSTLKINAEALKEASTTKEIKKIEVVSEENESIVDTEEVVSEENESIVDTEEVVSEENESIVDTEEVVSEENESIVDTEEVVSEENESIVDTEEVVSEENYEIIEVSFAKNLLISIEEEVQDTVDIEEEITEEIILKDEIEEITEEEIAIEEITEEEIKEINIEVIEEEIRSLEDILILKNEIIDVKSKTLARKEEEFDESLVNSDVDKLVRERKYKEAYLELEKVLKHYEEFMKVGEMEITIENELVEENPENIKEDPKEIQNNIIEEKTSI